MFSGIIESVETIMRVEDGEKTRRLSLSRPSFFSDVKVGDSIACNGVCLTVEKLTSLDMTFALGAETLDVLAGASSLGSIGQRVNVERSLPFGGRMHGHWVTGHVDSLGLLRKVESIGESYFMQVEVASDLASFFWKKGSVALHGVSLTVNMFEKNHLEVCLIPETLLRTNLKELRVGDSVHVESDFMAKAIHKAVEAREVALGNRGGY